MQVFYSFASKRDIEKGFEYIKQEFLANKNFPSSDSKKDVFNKNSKIGCYKFFFLHAEYTKKGGQLYPDKFDGYTYQGVKKLLLT